MESNAYITVLIVEPGRKPYVKDIDPGLRSLQHEVDGYITTVRPFADPVVIICDEEAKMQGKALNRALYDDDGHIYDVIAGTFMVAGLGDEDFESLTEEQVARYSSIYKDPESFIKLGDKILVLPFADGDYEISAC